MIIDKAIERKRYCERWVDNIIVQKLKTINEKIFMETWLGMVLILTNYFIMRKLVHTTGEAFIPNYPVDANKYIVILTWLVFTIIAFISVVQLIIKNKVYVLDSTLSDEELSYLRYKLINRTIKVTILVLSYITLYQILFQFTIEGIDIKRTILWWIVIVNIIILLYFIWINIKNKFKVTMLNEIIEDIVQNGNKDDFEVVYEKFKDKCENYSHIKSMDLNITLKAIEELIVISKKVKKIEEKSLLGKTELIANISHDLKTPLTSIINYVDFLSRDNLTKEDREEFIDILDRKSKRLNILIQDLKESVGAETRELKLELEEISLAKLLKQSLIEQKERINNSNLEFIVNIIEEENLKDSLVDKNKILRVFDNLIWNILKYSEEGSKVYIKLEQEESIHFEKGYYTRITFKNTALEEISFTGEELTQRFKRGDTSRKTEGSGLGLHIAKGLLKLQGGEFKVMLQGSIFIVDIIL